ncbi:MAG: DUF1573 domain-containing protein [Alistipes sp.]|jgi:hypothetical protein|nr:DUF1573 domain-containing protein [Alistipes sp.]
MKHYKNIIYALALVMVACGGPAVTRNTGGAVFDISPDILIARTDTLVDIGRVREGETVQYNAHLRNTGSEPLVVKEISTSCGCTSVEYEKRPIAPGTESPFSLRLDTRGMWGTQYKLIEIHTSASPHPYKIAIMAEVEESEN